MVKKTNKSYFILAFALLFLFSIFSLASAYYDWNKYGGSTTLMPNAQYENAFGRFSSSNLTSISTNDGYGTGYINASEPLISNFNLTSGGFSVFQNGDYIKFYTQYGQNVVDYNIGLKLYAPMHIGLVFDNTGNPSTLAGIWKINNTWMSFITFSFDPITYNFTMTNQFNFSEGGNEDYSNGVRCVSGSANYQYCNTLISEWTGSYYNYYYLQIYSNLSYNSYLITNGSSLVNEPLSWVDANNDGLIEYLFTNSEKAVVFNQLGAVVKEITPVIFSGGQPHKIQNARFFKSDTTNQYRVFITDKSLNKGDSTSCGTVNPGGFVARDCLAYGGYRLDGSSLYTSVFDVSTAGNTKHISNIAVLDYDRNNIDDIFFVTQGSMYIIKGSDGSVRYNKANPITFGTSATYQRLEHLNVAYLNNTLIGYPEFIATDGETGKLFLYDPNLNRTMLNASISAYLQCSPSDIDLNSFQELICLGSTNHTIFSTNSININAQIVNIITNPLSNIPINSNLQININAMDDENDFLYYYLDCGNGIIRAENSSASFSCSYNSSGNYVLIGYVRDQFHSEFNSLLQEITIGGLSTGGDSSFIGGFINPILELFPDADTLSLGQKLGIVLIVMLFTALIILFAGSQLGSEGINKFLIYVIGLLVIIEFFFFVGISYIPIGIFITMLLVIFAILYLAVRGRGGS
jgi:hypothetical protein